MYNGIGLQTPRGSGTNGYIQNNKFFVKPKTNKVVVVGAKDNKSFEGTAGVSKKPNKDILEHDRKRQIQLKLVILEDKLVEQGYTDAEISEKLDEARRTLDAASAAEEAGGPNAVIVVDKKVSDTQTHQIAARKEKQMEILKAALGIGSEPDNQKKPLNGPNSDYEDSDVGDKPKTFWKNGASDGKRQIKDIMDEKDDVPKDVRDKKNERGKDELEKKKESKTRLHEDSSDTVSSGKHVKRTKKKHWKGGHRSESNNDSDSDSNVKTKRQQKSSRKYARNRRHDSDYSDSYSKSGSASGYEKGRKRHDSDHDDSSFDEGRNCGTQKLKQHPKRSGRHYPEDESDTNSREEYETHQLERMKNQQSRSYRIEKGDSVSHDHRRINDERREKGSGRYGVESNFGSDRIIQQKKEKVKKSGRWQDIDKDEPDVDYDRKLENRQRSRRHDSDDDRSDDVKSDDSHEISNESDSGTDSSNYRHEKNNNSKSLGKSGSGHGDDLSGKNGDGTGLWGEGNAVENDIRRKEKRGHLKCEYKLDALMKLEELYHSRRDNGDGSGPDSQVMMRYKRKIDDGNQDELPEAKSRSRNLEREGDRSREIHKDTNTEFEENSRSYQRRDEYLRSSRSGGGRDSEKVEGGVRSHGRREQYHGSRKNGRDYDEHGEDRRQNREEQHGGRKHRREDEEELYRKHLKDGEHHHGRHGREQEGDRGTSRNERDRQVDSSKRYDNSWSKRRRYDNDRHDDGRSRR